MRRVLAVLALVLAAGVVPALTVALTAVAEVGPAADVTARCEKGIYSEEITLTGFDATGVNHIHALLETSNASTSRRDEVDEDFGETFHVTLTSVPGPTRGSGSLDVDTWDGNGEEHSAGTMGPGACPLPTPSPAPTVKPARASITGPCNGLLYRWRLSAGGVRTTFTAVMTIKHKGKRTFIRTVDKGGVFVSVYKPLRPGTYLRVTTKRGTLATKRVSDNGSSQRCP